MARLVHGRRPTRSGALLASAGIALASLTVAVGMTAEPAEGALSANLLTNPGFESGLGGWLASGGSPTASTYGAPGNVPTTAPGPPSRGTTYLSGGDQQTSLLEQQVSVAAYASDISSGKAQLEVSGYLGGKAAETDWARINVHYLNSLDQVVGIEHYVLGAGRVERNSTTALLFSVERFPMPLTAQKVQIVVELKRTTIDGTNDAYVDALSLKVVNIGTVDAPPPVPAGSSPELVRNGKFDAAAGGTGGVVRAPNWPKGIAVKYNAPGGWPNTSTDPVPTDHGPNFWAGDAAAETLSAQKASVVSWSAVLDKGKTVAKVSAYLGKWHPDADFVVVRLAFIDAFGGILTSVEIFGPGQVESLDRIGLWYVGATALVPAGTRSVQTRLQCVRNTGTACDGYADDVSVRLLNVPPAPKITGISPSSIPHGQTTTITINGSGFKSGAKVSVSGNAVSVRSVTFVSATRLKASIRVGADAALTKRTVTVTNPSTVKASCTCLRIT